MRTGACAGARMWTCPVPILKNHKLRAQYVMCACACAGVANMRLSLVPLVTRTICDVRMRVCRSKNVGGVPLPLSLKS
jgi:hypothetical protein